MSERVPQAPCVSIIVVNFNGERWIRACIESLVSEATGDEADEGEGPAAREGVVSREIVIVENGSTDGSGSVVELLEHSHSEVRVHRSPENLGYAGGVNAVLADCRGRYVVVLNMDIVAEPGWLLPLVEFLDTRTDVGAVNPMIVLDEGQWTNAVGQDIHVTALGFNRGLGSSRESWGREPFPVSGIQGAAIFMRRDLLERIGGLDASGFLYHEDVNLSWMLCMMGYGLYCVPASAVRHDYFLSMHAEKLYLLERNRVSLLLSFLSPTSLLLLSPMLLVTEVMLWGYALLRGPAFLKAKLRSYLWIRRTRELRRGRRRLAAGLRARSDWQVLRHMKWGYAWRQFAALAGEKGAPRRHFPSRRAGS